VREIEARNGPGKPVLFQAESEKVGQPRNLRRDYAGEVVMGQIEAIEAEKGGDCGRKRAGEIVE